MDAQHLYRQLADYYLGVIKGGTLSRGERMPSVRAMMRLHEVSLSTALQACRQLEREGWIEARPRSGYFVSQPKRARILPLEEPNLSLTPDPAQYVGIHARVSEFIAQGRTRPVSVNLSGARAAPSLYPAEQLRQAAIRAMRRHPDMLVRATPPGGNQAFRSALARRALESGMVLAAEDITVTHGCIEALNLALRAVAQPGDTIAVESPGFLRFAPDPGKPRPAGARNTDQRDHRAIGRGVGTRIACLRQHQGGGRRAASAESPRKQEAAVNRLGQLVYDLLREPAKVA